MSRKIKGNKVEGTRYKPAPLKAEAQGTRKAQEIKTQEGSKFQDRPYAPKEQPVGSNKTQACFATARLNRLHPGGTCGK